MSVFVDSVLVQLSDPAQVVQLLAPASDAAHQRLLTLLDAVYDLPGATIHDVRDLQVQQTEIERALFPKHFRRGTWTQTQPSFSRTDVTYESQIDSPVWLDLSLRLGLTLVLEIDAGEIESIVTQSIEDFNTLDEFKAHFQFIDLDAFMAEHQITTVEELKERYHYLLAQIRLRAAAPFDPNSPANQHRYALNVAVLIREAIDVAANLREAKLARHAIEQAISYRWEVDAGDVRTPYAPLIIFAESALNGLPFGADALRTLFADEQILALFVPQP